MSTILEKIKSVKLCLMAHPDNEKNSEFSDRISDLEEIEILLLKDKNKLKDFFQEEGLKRASQNNFNQAEAGYNAKWFRRGAMFGYEKRGEIIE